MPTKINCTQHTLQAIWVLGFPEVSGGKMVLYLGDLLRLFAIARVANLKNGFNLVSNPYIIRTLAVMI